MKFIVLGWFLFSSFLVAGVKEVRSYKVSLPELIRVSDVEWKSRKLGDVLEVMPFESRFLKEGAVVRDASELMGGIWGENELGSQAVYLVEESRLVIFGEKGDHLMVQVSLKHEMVIRLKTELTVFTVGEVKSEPLPLDLVELPKDHALVAKLSFLHFPGQMCQTVTHEGGFEVECESYVDQEFEVFENQMIWKMNHEEVKFTRNMLFVAEHGKRKIFEVGSLDGEKTVLVSSRQSLVMLDGSPYDDWILKEEQGAFLAEARSERLKKLAERWKPSGKRLENGLLVIVVPPTFLNFISHDADESEEVSDLKKVSELYPELRMLKSRSLTDVTDFVKKNGIPVRDGHFVVYDTTASKIYMKLTPEMETLVDAMFTLGGPDYPSLIQLNLVQFMKDGTKGKEIRKKIVAYALPGQVSESVLGGQLKFEVEANLDSGVGVEARFSIYEKVDEALKPIVVSGGILIPDQPLVIHESEVGGVLREWILTVRELKF